MFQYHLLAFMDAASINPVAFTNAGQNVETAGGVTNSFHKRQTVDYDKLP